MIENDELKDRLILLKIAFCALQEAWNNHSNPTMEEDISYKYPFDKSFDELTLEVSNWVNIHVGRDEK